MRRKELEQLIIEHYNTQPDYPWIQSPCHAVFRHSSNQKWLALIIDVPKSKLGLRSGEYIDVVNFKCDPILIGTLQNETGFFPAYHMSKANWISVALDGSVSADKIKWLLDMSYDATMTKTRKQGR